MAPELPVEEEDMPIPDEPRIRFVVRVCDIVQSKTNDLAVKIMSFCKEYRAGLHYRDYHWAYFSLISFISGILLLAFRRSHESVSCVDCFFLAISALTGTGLAPVVISSLSTMQQVLLCLNFFLGSPLVVGLATVLIRIKSFESKFAELIHNSRQQSAASTDTKTSANSTTGKFLDSSSILSTLTL